MALYICITLFAAIISTFSVISLRQDLKKAETEYEIIEAERDLLLTQVKNLKKELELEKTINKNVDKIVKTEKVVKPRKTTTKKTTTTKK